MIMDLPIFFPENKRYAKKARKGINLRFLNANNRELGCISRMAIPGEATAITTFCNNNLKIHIGIGLFGSEDIKQLGTLTSFLLFAPLASADGLENDFQLIFSKWEAEAIKRYLDYCEIDSNEVKIVTNFDANSSYVKPFKNILEISSIKVNNEINDRLTSTTAIILIAGEKWRILRELRSSGALKKKIVITTSSIEDWQVPPPIRKMFAKNVVYTYPTLAGNSENIINRFEQEFGYKPSVSLPYTFLTLC